MCTACAAACTCNLRFFSVSRTTLTMFGCSGKARSLCRALMLFGAPTHRLEEYLQMTARVLEIDSQFLYLPGCMIISFDDRSTHTTEVKIVR